MYSRERIADYLFFLVAFQVWQCHCNQCNRCHWCCELSKICKVTRHVHCTSKFFYCWFCWCFHWCFLQLFLEIYPSTVFSSHCCKKKHRTKVRGLFSSPLTVYHHTSLVEEIQVLSKIELFMLKHTQYKEINSTFIYFCFNVVK